MKSFLPRFLTNSFDELADLATAGLLHDFGLEQIPKPIVAKYLMGEEENLNPSEKVVYIRHPEITIELLKKTHTQISPAVARMIHQHHENFDGSGFKGLIGAQIFQPARILRIADEVVNCVVQPSKKLSFTEAIDYLRIKNEHATAPLFDPQMLAAFLQSSAPAHS